MAATSARETGGLVLSSHSLASRACACVLVCESLVHMRPAFPLSVFKTRDARARSGKNSGGEYPHHLTAGGLAARAVARLEANAASVHAGATEKRGFQAVSSTEGFSALIRHGKTVIEIENDSFSIRQID